MPTDDTDHRAEALAQLRAATNLGGYPQDGEPRTLACLIASGVHALLDIGAQLRANAPVPLEPIMSATINGSTNIVSVDPAADGSALVFHPDSEGIVHIGPFAQCNVLSCLAMRAEQDDESVPSDA